MNGAVRALAFARHSVLALALDLLEFLFGVVTFDSVMKMRSIGHPSSSPLPPAPAEAAEAAASAIAHSVTPSSLLVKGTDEPAVGQLPHEPVVAQWDAKTAMAAQRAATAPGWAPLPTNLGCSASLLVKLRNLALEEAGRAAEAGERDACAI
jgi:hypothetical protein